MFPIAKPFQSSFFYYTLDIIQFIYVLIIAEHENLKIIKINMGYDTEKPLWPLSSGQKSCICLTLWILQFQEAWVKFHK